MLILLLTSLTLAAPSSGEEPWVLTPEIGTEVPLSVDVGLRLETPYRFRLRLGVGYLPRPYLQGANSILTVLFPASYTEENAALVEGALARSLLLRSRLSWRPAPSAGFVFGGGSTFAALGGDATAAELVEGLIGASLPPGGPDSDTLNIDAAARVLLVEASVGWEIRPWPKHERLSSFQIRPVIGWAFSAWSRSDLTPTFEVRPAAQSALDQLESAGETYLDDLITGYVHPPMIGVHVGWRLKSRE